MFTRKKAAAVITASAIAAVSLLTACGGGDYQKYASAYKKVTANGGMQADFTLSLSMDGENTTTDGSFKLDTSGGKNVLLYEMKVNGAQITQFSDGDYLYTDNDGHKTKFSLGSKPSSSSDRPEAQAKDSQTTFNSGEFLNEFSSFLEAGKIKELGLLSPIEQAAVKSVQSSQNGSDTVYTLSFSESLVKKYLNTLIENETGKSGGDSLSINELNNFTYEATVSGGIVTKVKYGGVLKVDVPASLMSSGSAASYDMDFTIDIKFVNPGSAVQVSIPSTDGFTELS